jgi:hypothetical protein
MRNWKEFNIYTINKKHEDMGIDSQEEAKICIDLNTVSSFNETYHSNTDELGTAVYLDSGDSAVLRMKYEDFKKLIMI